MSRREFPLYYQVGRKDCGPTCLRMVAKYYGKSVPLSYLNDYLEYEEAGVSLLALSKAAAAIGFKPLGVKLTFEELAEAKMLPAILHWNRHHFVVVHPGSFSKRSEPGRLFNEIEIADPVNGIVTLSRSTFEKRWCCNIDSGTGYGVALFLEKTPLFDHLQLEDDFSIEEV